MLSHVQCVSCFQLFILLKCREFIINYINSKEKPAIRCNLTDEEWTTVQEIVDILKTSYETNKMLQTPGFTLSDFYAEWLLMEGLMKKQASETLNENNDLLNQLLNSLKTYSAQLLANPMLAAAVFLDPRFSRTMKKTPRTLAISKLLKLWERINNNEIAPMQVDDQKQNTENFHRLDALEVFLAETEISNIGAIAIPLSTNESNSDKMHRLLEEFNDFPREKPVTKVIEYWEANKETKPELYRLSLVVNVISPTQVPTEKSFSIFNHVFSPKRYNLKHHLLEDIMLINLNKDLFEVIVDKHLKQKQ